MLTAHDMPVKIWRILRTHSLIVCISVVAFTALSVGSGLIYSHFNGSPTQERAQERSAWEWTTLAQAGFEDTDMHPTEAGKAKVEFTLQMPEGTAQTEGQEYIGYVRLGLKFAEPRPVGVLEFSGSTNDLTFMMHRIRSYGLAGVTLSSPSNIGGGTITTYDTYLDLPFINEIRFNGVNPGPVSFEINAYGDLDILEEITVFNDSGILRMPFGPPKLTMALEAAPDTPFAVGVPSIVPISLSSNGWPIADVTLSGEVIEGSADISFDATEVGLVTDAGTDASVTVIPRSSGETKISLEASGHRRVARGVLTLLVE